MNTEQSVRDVMAMDIVDSFREKPQGEQVKLIRELLNLIETDRLGELYLTFVPSRQNQEEK